LRSLLLFITIVAIAVAKEPTEGLRIDSFRRTVTRTSVSSYNHTKFVRNERMAALTKLFDLRGLPL
jgi:hypothetical protein